MNSKDLIISKPDTIQNYDNYLKDYINLSGFNWNTDCLTITYTKLGNNFNKYITKVGDYNTVTAKDVKYFKEETWQEKDYSQPCPEGWTEKGGGCVNFSSNVPKKCNSGRTFSEPKTATCPEKRQAQFIDNGYWRKGWRWWGIIPYQVDEYVSSQTPNENYYSGWSGPTDASQVNFERTNIGQKNQGEGTFCTAGWAAGNSLGGAQLDCAIGGGQWVTYWDDPGFWSNSYTCYKPTENINVTQPPSYFFNYNDDAKRNWEKECEASWPMKTITIPARYTCNYGISIEEDIAKGNIFQIGSASSSLEAAKLALNSLRLVDNYFFMIDSGVYIIGQNSNVGVITSKEPYEQNCTEKNNKKGTLYYINQEFFDELNKCKIVNTSLNNTNESRDILQSAINSVREGFTSLELENIKAIANNQNEINENLVSDYNKKAELYNYQVDLIGQNEKLVEAHNKKLNQQLNDLTSIQDQIALKDRVIELNDELTKKQIRNKKILIGFFVLIPLLGIPLLLVVTRVFSSFVGLGIAGLFIVGYIIYMYVVSNQNNIKNFGREDKRVISKYESAIANYWNKQKEALSKSLSKFVNGECADNSGGDNLQEEETSGLVGAKDKYLMKSNSPFYYYDGSAPPQQIYPGAIGSIDFSIDGIVDKNIKFPKEIINNFDKIKNPVTQFFFQVWLQLLMKSGISLNDPRFAEDLDVIDFPDSDQTPPPYWDAIKLPIVTNLNEQFSYLFKSLSEDKRDLSTKVSSNLVDLWNFIKGNKIPGDVYEKWVNRLENLLKEDKPDIENFYSKFTEEIMNGINYDKFVELKIKEIIKIINTDIHVSQPFIKKYI